MKVIQVTPTGQDKQSFSGQYKILNRARYPREVLQKIVSAPFLKDLSKENDVYVRLMEQRLTGVDAFLSGHSVVYNLSFAVLPENSLKFRIKDIFCLVKRHRISSCYQTPTDLANIIEDPKHISSLIKRCLK